MRYAPVLIPTLNRKEHLKKCIESLINNKLFSSTEVFISVDYPPSDKYKNGYLQVVDYLKKLESHYSNIKVAFQHDNLGAYDNCMYLIDWIKGEKYDRYIITEDDNIFSKNFLEYMNWGLNFYQDDRNVVAVCGYSQNISWSNKVLNKSKVEFNVWGYGTWLTKIEEVNHYIIDGELNSKLHSFSSVFNIFIHRPDLAVDIGKYLIGKKPVMVSNNKIASIDITKSMYLILSNRYVIMPTVTKVNNIGYDGSGINCKKENYIQGKLDDNDSWNYELNGDVIYSKQNDRLLRHCFIKRKIENLLNRICKR